jgi:NADH-quinone oxidoreductase subunit L
VAHWIRSGSFSADFALYLDRLSLMVLLNTHRVGFLIHIYSVGYMWDDPSYYRFSPT